MAFARRTYRPRKITRRPRKVMKKPMYRRRFSPRTELKVWESTHSTAVTTTPQVVWLNAMRVGTGSQGRIGDKVFMKSIHIKGYLQNPDDYDIRYLRMLIVWDKQTNNANPVLENVLTVANDVTAMRNLDHRYRFKVLYDKLIKFDGESVADASKVINIFKRINHSTIYGTDGQTQDCNYGGLFLMLLGTDSTDGTTIKFTYRIRYTDN